MSHTELTADELQAFSRRLQELSDRLTRGVDRLKAEALRPTGAEGSVAEPPAQEPVSASTEGEEDVARTLLLTEEQILAETQAALARLKQGTFGHCECCGHVISKKRLEAIPYARLCIRCARLAETKPAD